MPTIFDRCVQALWSLALDPVNEALSDDHSYGFRKGRAPKDGMAYTHKILNLVTQPEYILEIDIRKCFDTIDHKFIMKNILVNKKILNQWLKCGVMEANETFYYDEYGVPQGGIISPIICNLTLNGFESFIKQTLKEGTTKRGKNIFTKNEITGFGFCRFADDMVIIANNLKVIHFVKVLLEEFLKE